MLFGSPSHSLQRRRPRHAQSRSRRPLDRGRHRSPHPRGHRPLSPPERRHQPPRPRPVSRAGERPRGERRAAAGFLARRPQSHRQGRPRGGAPVARAERASDHRGPLPVRAQVAPPRRALRPRRDGPRHHPRPARHVLRADALDRQARAAGRRRRRRGARRRAGGDPRADAGPVGHGGRRSPTRSSASCPPSCSPCSASSPTSPTAASR